MEDVIKRTFSPPQLHDNFTLSKMSSPVMIEKLKLNKV